MGSRVWGAPKCDVANNHRDDKGSGKIVKRDDHLMDATRYLIGSGRSRMTTAQRRRQFREPLPIYRGPNPWMARKRDTAPFCKIWWAVGRSARFTLLVPNTKWDDRVDSGIEAYAATGKCRWVYARRAGDLTSAETWRGRLGPSVFRCSERENGQ